MGGKMSRTKGHSYERKIAGELRKIFPDAKRHLEVQASDCYGVDLDNTGSFAFQLKRYKKYCSLTKIKEIQLSKDDHFHVLVTKGDNEPSMACMYWDDFLLLVHSYQRSLEG